MEKIIPFALLLFFGYTLSSFWALGKLLAVGIGGLWLSRGPVVRLGVLPLAYLAAVTWAAVFSADPWLSLFGLWGTYSSGLLAALVLVPFWCCVGPGERPGIERGLRWGGAVMAIVGIGQWFGVGFMPHEVFTGNRVYATMGSPIYAGAAAVLCLPFARSTIERALLIGLLLATGSRGAWFACAIGAIYQTWPLISRRVRYWGLVSALSGLVAAFWLRPVSDLGRVVTWAAAVDAFFARPWLGWGTGNFLTVAELWRNPAWAEAFGATTQDHAHNLFLEAAATSGIVGLWAICGLLYALWSAAACDRKVRSALLGVFLVGLLNPLPLVVKALCLMIAASCAESRNPLRDFKIVKGQSFIIILAILLLIHWDRSMTYHSDYPWAFSSIRSAHKAGLLKETVSRRQFGL